MSLGYESLGPESGFPVITDPYVDEVLALAAEYQKDLDYTPSPNEALLRHIVNDLDERWPYHGDQITVTGRLVSSRVVQTRSMLSPDGGDTLVEATSDGPCLDAEYDSNGDAVAVSYRVINQQFESQGFYFDQEPWPELVGGHAIGSRMVIKLLFEREVNIYLDSGEDKLCSVTAAANPKDIYMGLPFATPYMAEVILQDYFGEVTQHIDQKLEAAPTKSEKVMSLKNDTVPCDNYEIAPHVAILEAHINKHIRLSEERAPFEITLPAGAVLFKSGEQQFVVDETLEQPRRIGIFASQLALYPQYAPDEYETTYYNIDENGEEVEVESVPFNPGSFEVRLVMQVVAPDGEEEKDPVEIRLSDITGMRSVRDSFYPENTTAQ